MDKEMMRAPQNDPQILSLSDDAQAVLAGHWGWGSGATLTLLNQKSRLSSRGDMAMRELISAGIISDEKADDGYQESRTYRLTEYGASLEFRKSLRWMDLHGKFSIVEAIPTARD